MSCIFSAPVSWAWTNAALKVKTQNKQVYKTADSVLILVFDMTAFTDLNLY